MELKEKDIMKLKDSIQNLNELSSKEKDALVDSIEMLWLNAGIQKKKKDIKIPDEAEENISRIRQLLATAWSEDLKD